ncbi:MAG TPA: MoaD/ThiS family protein, partial [Anaerolineales bacterium]|nr:MoaD/ThiS family protein [Anaerolineales bacterium]
MKISVLLFASIKEHAGTNIMSFDIEDKSTVADLKQEIANHLPALKDLLPTALVSINHEFAFPEDKVPQDAEIAIFPPVSGGQEKPTI